MPTTDFDLGRLIVGCGTFGGIGGSKSLIGKGLDETAAFASLDEAAALGVTMLDTAESYADGTSETMMRGWFAARDTDRTGPMRVTTKVAPALPGAGYQPFDATFIEGKFSGSLARLGVDRVDTLLIHAPDEHTPADVTLAAMEAVRATGRCAHLGACNLDAAQLTATLDAADRMGVSGYEVIQNGFSLLSPDDDGELRSICRERGILYTAFSPLAGGVLTGKYRRGEPPPADSRLALRPDGFDELLTPAIHDAIDFLNSTATELGTSCGALAMAWLLHHPDVAAPIAGPGRMSPHLGLAGEALEIRLSHNLFETLTTRFRDAVTR